MQDFIIRNYDSTSNDATQIGSFDQIAELAYRYKGDMKPENIFCAVDAENTILGVVDLEPHITWTPIGREDMPADYVYKLCVNLRLQPDHATDQDIRSALMDAALQRAREIQLCYPKKNIRIIKYVYSNELEEVDFFLSKGFLVHGTSIVMKWDLTEEIKPYLPKQAIKIINWKLESDEELRCYVETDAKCNNGAAWSFDTMAWTRYAPEWMTFSAFSGDEFLGSVMTFRISDEQSATENIFVVPEWQGKGVAKAFITEALQHLKQKGKTMATLCTDGDNKNAINLYRSLGYRMHAVMLEFGITL